MTPAQALRAACEAVSACTDCGSGQYHHHGSMSETALDGLRSYRHDWLLADDPADALRLLELLIEASERRLRACSTAAGRTQGLTAVILHAAREARVAVMGYVVALANEGRAAS